jgi:5-methylcytosine-specific restriction endonuclease McrA
MNTALHQHVLVLNRLWQAVNVCTARRALTLLFQGQAQVVMNEADGSFRTFNFPEWRSLSESAPHEESVHAISFRIRVPRVILLLMYDRLPKKEVKFTRHNIFERDKNTCQYCGKVFDRKDLNLDTAPRPQTEAAQVASIRADQLQPAATRQLEAFH